MGLIMKGVKIFLAEDDMDDVFFFTEALGRICKASTVKVCENGLEMLEALETAKDQLPDVVILDINMPAMDGMECLKQIRSKPYLDHVPIVMLTTTSSRNTVEEAHKAGASLYVKKPVIFEDLEAIIETIIRMNWLQHAYPVEMSKFVYVPQS
jgi:CheY-like chemotaxis protein